MTSEEDNINMVVFEYPSYAKWRSMMSRCYNPKDKSYRFYGGVGVTVCKEWHDLPTFDRWFSKQNHEDKVLDKDLLGSGKLYSPSTCCFITAKINGFISDKSKSSTTPDLIGVKEVGGIGREKKFQARCHNGTGKSIHLGQYATAAEAHQAWKTFKHSLACKFAEGETDIRVVLALRTRYL